MDMKTSTTTGRARAIVATLVLGIAGTASTHAQTIEQGLLQLEWGDPAPVAPGQAKSKSRFNARLVKDNGSRIALDPAQARKAAGDLYVLANRRVAIAFGAPGKTASSAPTIEAIVPVDRTAQSAPVTAASARVAAAAPVNGVTRWVTLMCKFSDIGTEQKTQAFFQSQYGEGVGQLGHYWREVSYNKINLAGSSAHGWFTLPQPRSHYVTEENGEDKADLKKLFADCGAAADAAARRSNSRPSASPSHARASKYTVSERNVGTTSTMPSSTASPRAVFLRSRSSAPANPSTLACTSGLMPSPNSTVHAASPSGSSRRGRAGVLPAVLSISILA